MYFFSFFKLVTYFKRRFSNEQFFTILQLKGVTKLSQERLAETIICPDGKTLSRSSISDIWIGKIKPLPNSTESGIQLYKTYFPDYNHTFPV